MPFSMEVLVQKKPSLIHMLQQSERAESTVHKRLLSVYTQYMSSGENLMTQERYKPLLLLTYGI